VQGYTLPQIEAFLSGLDAEDRRRNRMLLIACRAAQAKQDAFKKLLKEIG
jgi:hypothetical protein